MMRFDTLHGPLMWFWIGVLLMWGVDSLLKYLGWI